MPAPILPALAALLGRVGTASAGRAAAGGAARTGAAAAGTSSRSAQLLKSGGAFGDVLSGATSLGTLEKETEARERSTEASEEQRARTKSYISTIAKLNLATIGLFLLFKRMASGVAEANLRLADFGGQIGQAAAMREARTIERNIASAGARGSSAQFALGAQQDFMDSIRPLTDVMAIVANSLSGAFFTAINAIAEGVGVIVKTIPGVEELLEAMEDEARENSLPGGKFIDDIAAGRAFGERDPGERAFPPGRNAAARNPARGER